MSRPDGLISNNILYFLLVATLHEYFYIDFQQAFWIPLSGTIHLAAEGEPESTHDVEVRVHLAYESNAAYVTVYVPPSSRSLPVAVTVLESISDTVGRATTGVVVNGGKPGDPNILATEFVYAGRVFLYIEDDISAEDVAALTAVGKKCGLSVVARTREYQRERARSERPVAFISHDANDSATIAQPLASRLSILGCPVWFDRFSLRAGVNLRESIERGIRDCKKCVLILSSNFLANNGWAKSEFETIFNREIIERQHVMIPVWVDVSAEEVHNFCGALSGRYALQWRDGLDHVAQEIRREIESS
jgi:TIR domain